MKMGTEPITMSVVSDLKIEVPWGHISGKVWGSQDDPPVLCIHGIQDNANTFDNLIPVLPSSLCYYAMDLPGHGWSSHFPSGFVYSLMEYCMSVNRIVEHFKWKKFIFMGHSLGGQIGSVYAALYPNQVEKLVVLDSVMPYAAPHCDIFDRIPTLYSKLYRIEEKMSSQAAPSYSEEEALRRLTDGRPSLLTREAAQVLFSRGALKNGDGYAFSADQRLKLRIPLHFTREQMLSLVRRIQCPMYLLRASETENAGSYIINADFENIFKATLHGNYHYKLVEGSHDVHLLHPEKFAHELYIFLLKPRAHL